MDNLTHIPWPDRRLLIASLDGLLLTTCFFTASVITQQPIAHVALFALAAVAATAFPIFIRFGLYRAILMFIGTRALYAIVQAVTLHVIALAALAFFWLGAASFSPHFFVTYWLTCLVLIGGSRVIIRSALRWFVRSNQAPIHVAIYGAGMAGAELAEALQGGSTFYPVAFIDDKQQLHGHEIRGLKIYPTSHLGELIKKFGIDEVFLAIPSVSRPRLARITQMLEGYPVHVRTVPSLRELVSGLSKVADLRELDPVDILARDSIAPDQSLLTACIEGKSVMVSGAGGSIGSELCRQILALGPTRLVLYERSEFALYTIHQELSHARAHADTGGLPEVIPLLGDVTDSTHVQSAIARFGVQTVYHAAAYKHVPLVEQNTVQGVFNNAIGTWNCAKTAIENGVETFILVSSDKAVRPTNVMGASKRFAELIVQAFATQYKHVRFSIVRFGNVLGSSGSVVPLFREQIRKGGPITLTHPEITRYFMTIPEAAQLVIQAGTIGGHGDVFVLDMGAPVRVLDLARRMVTLSGLSVRDADNPAGDIAIEVTCLRPGEKLHEELVINGEIQSTAHPSIMRVKEPCLSWARLTELVDTVQAACESMDSRQVLELLKQAVSDYRPGKVVDFLHGWTPETIAAPATPIPLQSAQAAAPR